MDIIDGNCSLCPFGTKILDTGHTKKHLLDFIKTIFGELQIDADELNHLENECKLCPACSGFLVTINNLLNQLKTSENTEKSLCYSCKSPENLVNVDIQSEWFKIKVAHLSDAEIKWPDALSLCTLCFSNLETFRRIRKEILYQFPKLLSKNSQAEDERSVDLNTEQNEKLCTTQTPLKSSLKRKAETLLSPCPSPNSVTSTSSSESVPKKRKFIDACFTKLKSLKQIKRARLNIPAHASNDVKMFEKIPYVDLCRKLPTQRRKSQFKIKFRGKKVAAAKEKERQTRKKAAETSKNVSFQECLSTEETEMGELNISKVEETPKGLPDAVPKRRSSLFANDAAVAEEAEIEKIEEDVLANKEVSEKEEEILAKENDGKSIDEEIVPQGDVAQEILEDEKDGEILEDEKDEGILEDEKGEEILEGEKGEEILEDEEMVETEKDLDDEVIDLNLDDDVNEFELSQDKEDEVVKNLEENNMNDDENKIEEKLAENNEQSSQENNVPNLQKKNNIVEILDDIKIPALINKDKTENRADNGASSSDEQKTDNNLGDAGALKEINDVDETANTKDSIDFINSLLNDADPEIEDLDSLEVVDETKESDDEVVEIISDKNIEYCI